MTVVAEPKPGNSYRFLFLSSANQKNRQVIFGDSRKEQKEAKG